MRPKFSWIPTAEEPWFPSPTVARPREARAATPGWPSRAWCSTSPRTTGRATPPLRRPSSQTIVYEMHVGGFTRHPSSGLPEKTRGTFAGLIAKIPYLQRLGITAVELLPVFQFDPQDCPPDW